MTTPNPISRLRLLRPYALHLVLTALLIGQVSWFVGTLATWLDEGDYLYKSTALVGHGLRLYSEELPSWYTPLFYLALGAWQEVAGHGLLAGRLFSAGCYLGSLLLLSACLRRIFPQAGKPFLAMAILVILTPSITLFQSSVTQFAFVNLQIAALTWVIFARRPDPWQWWLAGLLTGTIVMTRPNLLLAAPLLPLIAVWTRGWPGRRAVLSYLTAASAVIAALGWLFGPGALWNLVRAFPGGDAVAQWTGLTRCGWVGTLNGTDLGLKLFDWWIHRPETFRGTHLYFLDGYLWPYLLLVAANLATLFSWRRSGYVRSTEAGFALLFFWSSLVHFAGTQTFCPTCAHAYMNYSVPFGLLGGVPVIPRLVRRLCHGFHVRLARSWIPLAVSGLLLLAYGAAGWLPRGAYRAWYAPEMRGQVQSLASALKQSVPARSVILPLGEDIRLTEAIHAAGHLADPVLINYHFSQRESIDPQRSYTAAEEALIRRRGLWTRELLAGWLERKVDYVIVRKNSIPYKAHLKTLEAHYHLQPLIPGLGEGNPLSGYYLAQRVDAPRIAAQNQP